MKDIISIGIGDGWTLHAVQRDGIKAPSGRGDAVPHGRTVHMLGFELRHKNDGRVVLEVDPTAAQVLMAMVVAKPAQP